MKEAEGDFGSGTKFYKAEWRDGAPVDKWVRRMARGSLLNFPCGESPVGDVRADRDPSVQPDVVADIHDPPFDRREFGTAYIDTPYSMTAYDEITVWLPEIWKCVDHRLIVNTKPVMVTLEDADLTVYHEHRPGTPHLPTFLVYDRQTTRLDHFTDA